MQLQKGLKTTLVVLLGVLHAPVYCVSLCICLLVSYRCVSLLVRFWALDMWGELVSLKIFNPVGHSVSYSYICDICLECVNGVGLFLFSFKFLFG